MEIYYIYIRLYIINPRLTLMGKPQLYGIYRMKGKAAIVLIT